MERPNIFDKTIQDEPEEWTTRVWRAVYNFSIGGSRLASWNDNYVDDKFSHIVDPKDGSLVRDCRDAGTRDC